MGDSFLRIRGNLAGIADFDKYTTSGYHNVNNVSTESNSYPGISYGVLVVLNGSQSGSGTDRLVQIFYPIPAVSNGAKYRSKAASGTWSAWITL